MEDTQAKERVNAALARARAHSPFLGTLLSTFPAVEERLVAGDVGGAIRLARSCGEQARTTGSALRRERGALALALGIGDLAGALALEQVVGELSDFADRALEAALADAFAARTPDDEPVGFAILALGKLGSRELNYSSDIDLVFLFDPARLPLKPREEPGQGAVRIGQRVIETLQRRDGEGYVFRVDMRLRPTPEVTPIALPVDAAIAYYESQALPWERAAFIRARMVAGDRALGRYFLDAIHPFVWRRSLDFGAAEELQSITRRIRDHYAGGQAFGPGFDLKRGRGGIREIEFFAQIHQLIHGGRDPGLRAPATLAALAALAQAGRIAEGDAIALADAYRLYRTIEHRLQMVDDRQTHSLPAAPEALDTVARLHGLDEGAALLALLEPRVARVAACYGGLASGDSEEGLPHGAAALEARLAAAGFADPAAARLRVESWRSGKARALRTPAATAAFEAMLPGLIAAFGAAPDSAHAINRFDDIVERLPSGVNFFRLLQARPMVAEIVATILSHAPALADQLGRRPELLDGLLDASAFDPQPPVEALAAIIGHAEPGSDYQALLDNGRRRVNERRFALGVQLVAARSDPLEVAAGYARVAEAAIAVMASGAIAEFEALHGRVPGSELVVLGLGRLGGEALTHASDLDLIYLFTGSHEARSDGAKPLGATDYFNRLAQRVTAALSVATAAGPLYDVDTRLRPSGADGLLAVSLASFADYQLESAWTWEHMTLTRARPVFGSAAARAELQAIVDATLGGPRDADKLVADALEMRAVLARHKPPAGPYDIKLGEGGLVDLEFAVQVQQLRSGQGLAPQLGSAISALAQAGLAPAEIPAAHALLTRMLVTLRLVSPSSAEPPPASRALVAAACGHRNWEDLLAAHDAARHSVRTFWREVAGLDKE